MGSHTFRAFSTTNVSWICCNCDNPNHERNLFHSFQIETANSFHPLDLSESIEIKSPISDFVPVLHSSPIIDRRHSKKIKNWKTLILKVYGAKSKLSYHLSTTSNPTVFLARNPGLTKVFPQTKFSLLDIRSSGETELHQPRGGGSSVYRCQRKL